ncbi:Carnitine operon protein CaiE [Candidatus Lokiarchaeum ossiferum]|uniref:Carnitine operon protein CaiE n=1 Tax=Candidatus Lokiarchaeum ossiferum TaxID=2951803 RepID=A0ABY6HVQ0_9ARCH|nr:Carnitine operon protein CaiE [Candidatus Lokiarchaeum sp. B-35]
MPLLEYKNKKPQIDPSAWVSPNATLVGDIKIGPNSVIWPGVFMRAEYAPISIGQYVTIFDGVMMFTRSDKSPIDIGNYTIIETGTCIFGTFMTDYITIGENVLVNERSSIGEGAVIIAESTIASGMIVAERAIMKGNPASVIREQSRNDLLKQKERAEHYTEMFIRMRRKLPNLQPYAITENALLRELITIKERE